MQATKVISETYRHSICNTIHPCFPYHTAQCVHTPWDFSRELCMTKNRLIITLGQFHFTTLNFVIKVYVKVQRKLTGPCFVCIFSHLSRLLLKSILLWTWHFQLLWCTTNALKFQLQRVCPKKTESEMCMLSLALHLVVGNNSVLTALINRRLVTSDTFCFGDTPRKIADTLIVSDFYALPSWSMHHWPMPRKL